MHNSSIEQAVIIAGGKGTRLAEVTGHKSKILVEINGHTLLEDILSQLVDVGISRVLLLLGQGSIDIIETVSRVNRRSGIEIDYIVENTPLGTGGALLNAYRLGILEERFLLLHGDLFIRSNLKQFVEFYDSSNFECALVYHPSSHMEDSDLLELDDVGRVINFYTKPRDERILIRNAANCGVYIFSSHILSICDNSTSDLDRELIPYLIESGITFIGFRNMGFIRDVGTPERLQFVRSGLARNFHLDKRPALFLDRDGTLNIEKGYISHHSQIEIFSDIPRLIKRCNDTGVWVFVITNQPVLARGETTFEEMRKIHGKIDFELSRHGAYIDDYFLCPHHPDSGFPGEIALLKQACECRKPKIGLIEQAVSRYRVQIANSFFVGDSWRDEEVARNYGIPHYKLMSDRKIWMGDHLGTLDELEFKI